MKLTDVSNPSDAALDAAIEAALLEPATHADVLKLLELHRDSAGVFAAVSDCLRALSLQADRYDSEIGELRGMVAELIGITEGLAARLDAANIGYGGKG